LEITPNIIIGNFFKEHGITEKYTIRRRIFHKNSSDLRMVVISVGTVQSRDSIIRKIKTTMKQTNSNVYFNVDKTACELQLEYQLRLDLKDMIRKFSVEDKNKVSFYIKDKSIFKVVQGTKGHIKVQSFN
jgi:NAD-dependent SIR2 family protein deacetylase